jgi:tetratricopeptide (TPR) repeat protein
VRFASRLPERDRRLLVGYRLFDEGKPSSMDSLRAFVATYPDDVEGWYMLGEAAYHIQAFRPTSPDSISAVFDSVLRRDSTLFPALVHPLELALLYRARARFDNYFRRFARAAPEGQVSAMRTAAGTIWGPQPGDSALLAALMVSPFWIAQAAFSEYQQPAATSDSVVRLFTRVQDVIVRAPQLAVRALTERAEMLLGTGRWGEAKVLLDSLASVDPKKAGGTTAWAVVLKLTPPSVNGALDSAVLALPPGPEAEYARGMVELLRGRVAEGRRTLGRALAAPDSASLSPSIHGLMLAADGWGQLLQGDSATGIQRMRAGLDLSAAPNEETAFPRLQFALSLAARPGSRAEGIQWLKYGFEMLPLYKPLTLLALGHTYEAAGIKDSAAQAYTRFLRLWDKADPELQGRVREARAALDELGRERPQ